MPSKHHTDVVTTPV